jgi:hypothetical protein
MAKFSSFPVFQFSSFPVFQFSSFKPHYVSRIIEFIGYRLNFSGIYSLYFLPSIKARPNRIFFRGLFEAQPLLSHFWRKLLAAAVLVFYPLAYRAYLDLYCLFSVAKTRANCDFHFGCVVFAVLVLDE